MSEHNVSIEYLKLMPHEVSMHDATNNRIVIDEKFKDRPEIVEWILRHEMEHAKSDKKIDFLVEMRHQAPANLMLEILKIKPMSFFTAFIPVLGYKKDGEWIIGLDLFRLIFLLINLGLLIWFVIVLHAQLNAPTPEPHHPLLLGRI